MSKTVLVVEDNRDNRDIILEFLSAFGFDVISAMDGAEGVEMFQKHRPDLVLSDVLLPKINGFSVCERIKNDPNPVPVILMSALYKTHSLQAEARDKYGADDYLLKPLNLLGLAERICDLLGVTKANLQEQRKIQQDTLSAPESGPFEKTPPPHLFGFLLRHKRTGILTCQGKSKKTVYIKKGKPIYVTSDDPLENYAEMLVADGKITEAQKTSFARLSEKLKTTLGKLLVNEKVITNQELSHYLLEEVHIRLIDLISWSDGTFAFKADESFLQKIKRPDMALYRCLYQGIRKGDFWQYLSERYYAIQDQRVAKVEENLFLIGEMDMEMEDLETFALIDGASSIEQILNASSRDNISIFNLLWALELSRVITLK